jgi:hypothetical protein
MSDFAAGSGGGAQQGAIGVRSGGSPPPVLLAALGVAAVIAVLTLVLFTAGGGSGGDGAPGPGPGAAAAAPAIGDADAADRVHLTVVFEGDGRGRVEIGPRGDVCRGPCEHTFATGTRVTVTAEPAGGSTFDGWGASCRGSGSCAFVMDKQRVLKVSFGERTSTAPDAADDPCIDDPAAAACTDSLGPDPAVRATVCADGKDNDGDGLVDTAQDPGCDGDNTESDANPDDLDLDADPGVDVPPPPPPPPANSDCADGRDNDHDGLTDTAQDPDCLSGSSETGSVAPAPATSAPTTKKPAKSECRDGKDNDGDGLIDKAQDPGCESDSSEAD